MRVLKAAITYFGLVFGAGFLLGLIRVPLLVPRLGERWAELLEMPVMLLVTWWASRFVMQNFSDMTTRKAWLGAGSAALGLLLCAELLIVIVLQQQSVSAYLASRDPVSGTVYLLMLVLFGTFPFFLYWAKNEQF